MGARSVGEVVDAGSVGLEDEAGEEGEGDEDSEAGGVDRLEPSSARSRNEVVNLAAAGRREDEEA